MQFTFMMASVAAVQGFMAPTCATPSKVALSKVSMNGGKGFGGGEATRDPEPTAYDPNDPKGKQQAIHKAESFAEYLAKRDGAAGAVVPTAPAAPPPAAPPAGGSFFDDYMAKRGGAAPAAAAPAPAPAPPAAYVPPPSPPPPAMEHGKGFGGGEATRDPEPTYIDPNDPKGKQQAIHKAESFAEYLAKRAS